MWPRCGHRRAAASTRTWPDTSSRHSRAARAPARAHGGCGYRRRRSRRHDRACRCRKPEHKVDVVLLAEIHHFWAAVVTIATQGDSGRRPVPADAAYEPAQMASDLLTARGPPSNAAVIFLLATAGKAN